MNILWIKDNKIGHEKQVKVLLDELSKTNEITIINDDYLGRIGKYFDWPYEFFNLLTLNLCQDKLDWIDILYINKSLDTTRDLQNILNKTIDIDIIIGAGHGTHSRILYLKKFFSHFNPNNQLKAISILTPTFRKGSFDLICAPLHDKKKFKSNDENVIYFEGAISKVFDSPIDKEIGFIGIGGKNSHFKFDDHKIYEQIEYVLSLYPNKNWYIFNSRRTSTELNKLISTIKFKNYIFVNSTNSVDTSYDQIIEKASIKFVTQDSINMVYESLSSNGETILFNMDYINKDKVVNQIHQLLNNKNVGYIEKSYLTDGLKSIKIKKQVNHILFTEVEKLCFKLNNFLKQ